MYFKKTVFLKFKMADIRKSQLSTKMQHAKFHDCMNGQAVEKQLFESLSTPYSGTVQDFSILYIH